MKLGIANVRCKGATRVFEARVLAHLDSGRAGDTKAMRDIFEAHEGADWKDGFGAGGLNFEEATLLAAAIVWYPGAVPVVEGPVAWTLTPTYTVTLPGYAAW